MKSAMKDEKSEPVYGVYSRRYQVKPNLNIASVSSTLVASLPVIFSWSSIVFRHIGHRVVENLLRKILHGLMLAWALCWWWRLEWWRPLKIHAKSNKRRVICDNGYVMIVVVLHLRSVSGLSIQCTIDCHSTGYCLENIRAWKRLFSHRDIQSG